MGINLYIAKSIDDIYKGKVFSDVRLEDNIQDFIWKNREILSSHMEIYLKLDPYDNVILNSHEILKLKCFSETLLNPKNIKMLNFSREHVHESDYVSKEEYLQFANELNIICKKAEMLEEQLYSIGD